MADDLSLLFRLRGDAAGVKTASAEARAAVNQLKQSFGPELTQTVNVANRAFASLQDNLNVFVSQRIPLVGGAFVRVSENLRGFGKEGAAAQRAIANVAKSIQSIAAESGKTIPQITSFLTKFVQLEGQAKRDKAAIDFFGAALGAKLVPELEKAGTALVEVSAASALAGTRIAAMAGPIGIAVVAILAMGVGAAVAAKEIFDLSKRAAEFQGHMFDLAQQTGLAVETLSALEVVAKTTGGNLGTITQALVLFQRKLDDAQDPLSKTAELFRKFNIETTDTETSLRSAFTALARMPEGFAQTNAAAELFGARGGKQVLAILKESNGSIDETIKRLRELGILISDDAARAADKFNDELALLQFELRALGAAAAEDLIPALVEFIRTTGELVTALRPVISLLGTITAKALGPTAAAFKALSVAVQVLTRDYEGLARAIKKARDERDIKPLDVPDVTPVPLPGAPTPRQSATDAANEADAVVAIVKRSVAEQNQALDELFQKGRRDRQQQAEETIAGNKRILEAEKQRIDAQLTLKEQEIKALDDAQKQRGEIVRRDTEDYQAITKEIGKLQQERLDKESEFDVSSRAIRAKAAKERADSTRNQVRNESDLLVNEFDRTIKDTEAQIARGSKAEADGLILIEQLEQAKIEARIESLQKQKDIGLLTVQEQIDLNNELKKLEQERDQLGDEQRNRRLDRDRAAAERTRDILIANLDTALQLEQIAGERRIETLQALANLRVLTEEETAKRILAIRLSLIDSEIEATKSKLTATGSIADKDERIRTQADLNNQLKILTEQRVSIQATGNRDIDEGRKDDLENERQYANDLKEIKERIRDVEREATEEMIQLMIIHFASRRDIIRARLQIDLEDEKARHRNATETINNLERENRESKKTAEEKLEAEKEINALREAEAERHRLAMQGIKDQGRKDAQEADPVGRLELDLDSLKEFARVLETSIVPLGEILSSTFRQVSDAIGQTIANWVLLGETGPAVGRKILAAALANIAAEAAVNAIKELALGFATLFFNPAESAAHFTAAGLWGAIAGGSALAGRAVAGDLFKPKTSAAAGTDRSQGQGQLDPLAINRNQPQPPRVIVEVRSTVEVRPDGSRFGEAITAHVLHDGRTGGPIRQFNIDDE